MTIWNDCPAVEQVPGRASGAWVFSGTRVPLFALYENLASGATIKEFVEWFPGVDERQVRAVLEHEANALRRGVARSEAGDKSFDVMKPVRVALGGSRPSGTERDGAPPPQAEWEGGRAATDVKRRLMATYDRFFSEMGIDDRTGEAHPPRSFGHRFSTWPHIGSRYGEDGHRRILFVGLQWGHDPGYLQSLGQVQEWVERTEPLPNNPHIPGTCVSALRWLPARYGWDEVKSEERTCSAVLKDRGSWWTSTDNPLAFVGLTNLFKFITVGKANRDSKGALRHVDREAEQRLLVDEILECFRPDVVLFQSPRFRRWPHRLREEARRRGGLPTGMPEEVRVVYHPAYRGRRRPRDVVKARC